METTQEMGWSVLFTGPDPATIYTYTHAFCFSRTSLLLTPQACCLDLLAGAIASSN